MTKLVVAAFSLVLPAIVPAARAADPKPAKPNPPHGLDMDYGPFLCYSVLKPGAPAKPLATKPTSNLLPLPWNPDELIAHRGITVKLSNNAAICFDADTMRYAAAWTGGWLDLSRSHLANEKGSLPPAAVGKLAFTTPDAPGFASPDGSFADPRPNHLGPLPKSWAHFTGIYRAGDRVILAYTVGDAHVLDFSHTIDYRGGVAFIRTIRIDQSSVPIRMIVCAAEGGSSDSTGSHLEAIVANGDLATCAGLLGPEGTRLRADGKVIELTVPPVEVPTQLRIVIVRRPTAGAREFGALLQEAQSEAPLSDSTHGGTAPLWPQPLTTTGALGPAKDAYTIDTITLPEKNPWNSWLRLTALDFFSDGRCAFVTWNGDVWIASGIDSKLDHVTFRRFAAGLYDPLGLRIVKDQLYVLARDGIYRLHDLNGDGEADFYEVFNNDVPVGAHYNAFAMDLQTDSAGNFYYTVSGNAAFPDSPMTACIVKISPDGSKCEVVGTGLRTANGLGVGPHDQITIADNQGNWVPTSNIFIHRPGGFYGYSGDPNRFTKAQLADQLRKHPTWDPPPMLWIPYAWDNSAGSQVWASDRFGPLSGHLLHTSYGKAALFEVLPEQVDGVWQAALVQLPLRFDSGIQRARVNPIDGQIYAAGLHGWQTAGSRDGCLQRIRYTAKPFHLPTALHVTASGIRLTFPTELDPETANDPDSYAAEEWTYQYSQAYGSSDYKPSAPGEKGRDPLEITRATLSPDKKSVFLTIPHLKPMMQYEIKLRLTASDGAPIKCDVAGTIHRLANGEKSE
jgi:hypothetical protein